MFFLFFFVFGVFLFLFYNNFLLGIILERKKGGRANILTLQIKKTLEIYNGSGGKRLPQRTAIYNYMVSSNRTHGCTASILLYIKHDWYLMNKHIISHGYQVHPITKSDQDKMLHFSHNDLPYTATKYYV